MKIVYTAQGRIFYPETVDELRQAKKMIEPGETIDLQYISAPSKTPWTWRRFWRVWRHWLRADLRVMWHTIKAALDAAPWRS